MATTYHIKNPMHLRKYKNLRESEMPPRNTQETDRQRFGEDIYFTSSQTLLRQHFIDYPISTFVYVQEKNARRG